MNKIKVLIIDDSSVIRSIVREILNYEPNIEVVGEAEDPYIARELIKELNPDVLTLDVEMPKMDGITFLSNLMRLRPMSVVMLSTLTQKGADITFRALELGAIDFIAKPTNEDLLSKTDSFKDQLITKITYAATVEHHKLNPPSDINDRHVLAFNGCARANHLVAIGASTGGTEAIKAVLTALPSNSPPIVITLHIPEHFSARYAERMNDLCQVRVQEAKHGQKIKSGNVYIAPGGKHLKVESKSGSLFCTLEDSEPVNRHKPSVDVLFDSLCPIAVNTQAILLTGMGKDGAEGMLNLKNQGAITIIQDKCSSLIWGMPGSAFELNAHLKQCSLLDMASQILKFAALDRSAIRNITAQD